MSAWKYLGLSILFALNALAFGCSAPADGAGGGGAGETGSMWVVVLTRSSMTTVEAEYAAYSGWGELLAAEFDGRDEFRAPVVWRGEYVAAIGILRPNDPARIVLYRNGEYSARFVRGAEYRAGDRLAFVEAGADLSPLFP